MRFACLVVICGFLLACDATDPALEAELDAARTEVTSLQEQLAATERATSQTNDALRQRIEEQTEELRLCRSELESKTLEVVDLQRARPEPEVIERIIERPAPATRTAATAPIFDGCTPESVPPICILGASARIVEEARIWKKFGWKVVVQNRSDTHMVFDVKLQFLGIGGIAVDDDVVRGVRLRPNETRTVTDIKLVDIGPAALVTSTRASVEIP